MTNQDQHDVVREFFEKLKIPVYDTGTKAGMEKLTEDITSIKISPEKKMLRESLNRVNSAISELQDGDMLQGIVELVELKRVLEEFAWKAR